MGWPNPMVVYYLFPVIYCSAAHVRTKMKTVSLHNLQLYKFHEGQYLVLRFWVSSPYRIANRNATLANGTGPAWFQVSVKTSIYHMEPDRACFSCFIFCNIKFSFCRIKSLQNSACILSEVPSGGTSKQCLKPHILQGVMLFCVLNEAEVKHYMQVTGRISLF